MVINRWMIAAAGGVVLGIGLVGCTSASDSAEEAAVRFISEKTEGILNRLQEEASDKTGLTAGALQEIAGNFVPPPEDSKQPPTGEWRTTGYQLLGSEDWYIFVPIANGVDSALDTSSIDIYGCAELDHGDSGWKVSDEPCPAWLKNWLSPSFREISVEAALASRLRYSN